MRGDGFAVSQVCICSDAGAIKMDVVIDTL